MIQFMIVQYLAICMHASMVHADNGAIKYLYVYFRMHDHKAVLLISIPLLLKARPLGQYLKM